MTLPPSRAGAAAPLAAAARRAAAWFVALALLLAPLFAHGCHGDDVDHEPVLTPPRSNPDGR
jgi:hypothetical protein